MVPISVGSEDSPLGYLRSLALRYSGYYGDGAVALTVPHHKPGTRQVCFTGAKLRLGAAGKGVTASRMAYGVWDHRGKVKAELLNLLCDIRQDSLPFWASESSSVTAQDSGEDEMRG